MNFPIEAVFAILAIEAFRWLAQGEDLSPPSASVVAFATAGWIIWSYLSAAVLARRTRRRLRRAQGSTVQILEDFRFRVTIHKVILVVLCIAYISFTQWPAFVRDVLRLPGWSVIDDLAAIAPFVAAMVAGWSALFTVDRALSRRSWGLGEYIWFQARYSLLLVLGPWIVLKGIDDSRELWPSGVQEFANDPVISAIFFLMLVGVAAAYLPVFLKWLFRASSMPEGEMRDRLEKVCEKANMRFRDILIWRMDRARILNAGVMGFIPRYRYVMFSDALLESLQPAECEAVLAHEIAHSKYRHPIVYLMFTLGFVALANDFMALLPPVLRSDYLASMPILAILVVVYFRFLFGYLSRAFERQADVYAAGLMETPVPLMLALEKIALMSGDIRELRSWRHHSVNERVRYLSDVGYDPEAQAKVHRRMKALALLVVTTVLVAGAGAVYLWLDQPKGVEKEIRKFEGIVAKTPTHHHAWKVLGDLHARAGNMESALRCYGEALKNNPGSIEALNGLERLVVPEDAKCRTLANSFMASGFIESALREAQDAARYGPGDYRNFEILSRVSLAAGKFEAALEAAQKALKLAPDRPEVKQLLDEIEKVIERKKN